MQKSSVMIQWWQSSSQQVRSQRRRLFIFPAQQIDVESLGFDNTHINADREHHVSEEQAKGYIRSAMVSVTVWGGQYERYYSRSGAAYVNNAGRYIRTAYSAEQYDEKTIAFLEVLKKYGY